MTSLKSTLALGFLVATSFQAQAYPDFSGARRDTLFKYNEDRVRYVISYKEEGGQGADQAPVWKVQVLESVKDGLEKVVSSKNLSEDLDAAALHADLVNTSKNEGFVNPAETETVLDDGSLADMAVMVAGGYSNTATAKEGNNPIWKATNTWSWEWEIAFGQWIKKNVDKFFFVKHRIPTDCADVIISLRWIFARIHGLPIANTTTASGKMIGHMTEDPMWSNLPTAQDWTQDQRFLAALAYVKDATYTGSLKYDSYPIAIKPNVLFPGAHHLEFHSQGGHAMIVTDVKASRSSSAVTLMDSTLPVEIRRLGEKKYSYANQPDPRTGFLRVLWPYKTGNTWRFVDAEDHPGFSEEQYTFEFMGAQTLFNAAVEAHLSGRNTNEFSYKNWEESLKVLRYRMMERVLAVNQGLVACPQIDCSPRTAGWAEYSTPTRDGRLKELVVSLVETVRAKSDDRKVTAPWNKLMNEFLDLKMQGAKIPFHLAVQNVLDGKMSPDPRDSLAARWGL